MQQRGWRQQRTISTTDTIGRKVNVITGITRNADGKEVVALGIAHGPTATLPRAEGNALIKNVRAALTELLSHPGGA
ncbi:hypothetical protein [Amycolatopsis dendrobii]|uniref:Uncharacterized protein n=1 Tax=Amycolatopsis dendrobii TaxID=2760662 RepID=A0A7W3ZA24_9PSEU|nr:hypothetical protein [Amycolatopsis dendrobii]MBB1154016.1 hypothetical protein [Amycolatopsis dendrobii]